jgi:DNA-binding MarR family transcriptional regulator
VTGLDATIARALSGYSAGDVLSFDSLREAANAAQLTQQQVHGQLKRAINAGYIEPLRCEHDGIVYERTRPTEHQAGVHRLIRHYRRTDVPVVVGVAS